MTDEEVFNMLFSGRRPVIDGVEYCAEFWDNGSIWHLAPLDSDGEWHGTVRWWDKDGSFDTDIVWFMGS